MSFRRVLFFLLFAVTLSVAQVESNDTSVANADENLTQQRIKEQIKELKNELLSVDRKLNQESVWQKIYANHLAYVDMEEKIKKIERKIKGYKRKGPSRYRTVIRELEEEKLKLQEQLDLLKDYRSNPFKTLITPKEIKEVPTVTNPVAIISAFSYIKQLDEQLNRFEYEIDSLKTFIDLLNKKASILKELVELEEEKKERQKELDRTLKELEEAEDALSLHQTALIVYKKKVDEIRLRLTEQIKQQAKKAGTIGIAVLIILLFVLLFKWLVKRTITDNERFYMANKIINFTFFFLVLIILLFAYIENVSYLVTVLGFASAGIAIAMKDWFMSMLGWLVIVLGGSIHVGDRIRVDKDGKMYVGDVLDISLLRITMLEDITLTTYKHNRRAGRIIFIPNNYIFTDMIANYTHATLKTVWDGIDFTITFNSNHKKAQHIARETAKKYAKGYTDITRKQLNKLRAKYSLKNTNVEPRVYSFIEENGIRISLWYMTNAYATLTLRSTISAEILDLIKEEEDIVIAYPSQHLYLEKARKKPTLPDLTESTISL